MNITQLTPTPEGLRAVYVVFVTSEQNESGYATHIIERPVDAIAVLELDSQDIRDATDGRRGAKRGKKTKIVGIIMEGAVEPLPASMAVRWFERVYGDRFQRAKFIGYTRSDHSVDAIMEAVEKDQKEGVEFPHGAETLEMRETRRYWVRAIREATEEVSR